MRRSTLRQIAFADTREKAQKCAHGTTVMAHKPARHGME